MTERKLYRWEIALVALVFVAGLAIRLYLGAVHYLNPDEIETVQCTIGSFPQALRNSLAITHPPLLVVIAHVVRRFSRTDLAYRMAPILCGSLFPLLLFFWMRRLANTVAAMTVMFLLTLSPYLVGLSVQLRPYTLALFFASASLLVLDLAMESGRWKLMALYNVLLWLCIVSDYSAAWFVGAAGVYVLLRLSHLSRPLRDSWIVGQVGAVFLYATLFQYQVSIYRGDNEVALDALNGWLRDEFPRPENLVSFPFTRTLGQFEFLMAVPPLGWLAAILFAAGIFVLWTGRTRLERSKARALVALLVLPFVLNIAGAYAHQFPYGASRHCVIMGLFAAAGIAVFLGTLPRRVGVTLVAGLLLAAPFWSLVQLHDDIPAERHQRWQIVQALDYMRATIPPGSLIFTERATLNVLSYYAGREDLLPWPGAHRYFSENILADTWRVVGRDYIYSTEQQYQDGLAAFRRQYGLNDAEPVWVVDGGWAVVSGPPDPKLPFTKAIRVFQAAGR